MSERIRVIGVDPGSVRTGYGIIDITGQKLAHVDNGIIATNTKEPVANRLHHIHRALVEIVKTYQPTIASVELVFHARNAKSAILLGQARGAALAALASCGLEVYEYSATKIKQAVAGFGRADKQQVAEMISRLLCLPEHAASDAADALAAAICHSNNFNFASVNAELLTARRRTGRR